MKKATLPGVFTLALALCGTAIASPKGPPPHPHHPGFHCHEHRGGHDGPEHGDFRSFLKSPQYHVSYIRDIHFHNNIQQKYLVDSLAQAFGNTAVMLPENGGTQDVNETIYNTGIIFTNTGMEKLKSQISFSEMTTDVLSSPPPTPFPPGGPHCDSHAPHHEHGRHEPPPPPPPPHIDFLGSQQDRNIDYKMYFGEAEETQYQTLGASNTKRVDVTMNAVAGHIEYIGDKDIFVKIVPSLDGDDKYDLLVIQKAG